MKVYLAGPIFYYGDLLRNLEWAKKIREAFPGIDLYSPVENTDINGVEGKKKFAGSKEIADADNKRLDDTDILIACIDGDVLPSGTCAEIGKFHEKIKRGDHKYIVGICTDNRQCYYTHSEAKDKGGASSLGEQQYSYQNIYVTGLIKEVGKLVYTIEEVIEAMKEWLGPQEAPKQQVVGINYEFTNDKPKYLIGVVQDKKLDWIEVDKNIYVRAKRALGTYLFTPIYYDGKTITVEKESK